MIRQAVYRAHRFYKKVVGAITLGCRALVIRDGKVLLVRHSYQEGWYLPGGTVEKGEPLGQAVVRELTEECAIQARSAHLVGMFYSEFEGRSDHIALFRVDEFEQLTTERQDPEIAEIGFFAFDALPAGTSPATKRRLAEFRKGEPPPERW